MCSLNCKCFFGSCFFAADCFFLYLFFLHVYFFCELVFSALIFCTVVFHACFFAVFSITQIKKTGAFLHPPLASSGLLSYFVNRKLESKLCNHIHNKIKFTGRIVFQKRLQNFVRICFVYE